jgi:hypothetical protein
MRIFFCAAIASVSLVYCLLLDPFCRVDFAAKHPLASFLGAGPSAVKLESKEDRATALTAILGSLIETCKLNGIDPQAYLADIVDARFSYRRFDHPDMQSMIGTPAL